ncbi:uncharacterized protein LOC108670053 [Hyalella azteca]|uniref:Uncharacterized protein LOC108670053 n=1 Tax=Hyalella azteca TaxID=294128 RepID=A0A8B7NH84_HYAAZ|nr:uncharacterized protein LOC108670053 [Hyalella azteca]
MRKAGRQKDAIWKYFDEIPSGQSKGIRARCKDCGKELQGLVQRLRNHKLICKLPDQPDSEQEEEDGIMVLPEQAELPELNSEHNSDISSATDEAYDISQPGTSGFSPRTSTPQPPSSTPWTLSRKRSHSRTPSPLPVFLSPQGPSQKEPSTTVAASPAVKKCSLSSGSMQQFTIKTTKEDKKCLDYLVARMIYGTNSSFRLVEHDCFREMMDAARPGYKLPTRRDVAGRLLDEVFDSETEKAVNMLQGQTVCMSLDGWSNVSNEPVICSSVTVHSSTSCEVHLVDTVDTSGHSHTAEYLLEVVKNSISVAEQKFRCKIGSFVTDNAANVTKMRTELMKENGLICYGCSAHLLNLLAKDFEISNIKEHVVQIVKYFRNNHAASAAYRAAGGQALVVPQDVRWNTLADCLEVYLKNWPILLGVCDGEKRKELDKSIIRKVMDRNIKRTAEDMLKILKHISVALDKVQSDACNIGDATEVWKNLEGQLNQDFDDHDGADFVTKLEKRKKQALTPAHYLANILHPVHRGQQLSPEEENSAMEWAHEEFPNSMPLIMKFKAKLPPFVPYLFSDFSTEAGPLVWWLALGSNLKDNDRELMTKLFTTTASSAGVERIFSSFGLVQSSIRNRLGTAKAAKLVFIFKRLNRKADGDDLH